LVPFSHPSLTQRIRLSGKEGRSKREGGGGRQKERRERLVS